MEFNIQKKKKIVTEINEIAKKALSAIIADYSGISAIKMNNLRKMCRESNVYIYISRNTLLRRIVLETTFDCLKDNFIGPTLIAFSMKHIGAGARLFKNFNKENQNFKIKYAAFQGKLISSDEIDKIANLPTYEEAIVQFMFLIKEATIGKLIKILIAIKDDKSKKI